MSGDHTKYHGTAEVPKWAGLTEDEAWMEDAKKQWWDGYQTISEMLRAVEGQAEGQEHMSGDHNKYHMRVELINEGGLRFTKDETNELIEALEEAVYLLNPTEEDMQKKAGVYRVVNALEKLKEKDT